MSGEAKIENINGKEIIVIKLLTAPIILAGGRLTFGSVAVSYEKRFSSLETYEWAVYDITPLENVSIYLDPSREPKFSPYPGGGWCSPVYSKIEEAENAGIELEESQIIKCRCQNKPYISDEDRASLEQCGHAANCNKSTYKDNSFDEEEIPPRKIEALNKAFERHRLATNYDPSNAAPSLPGALVSESAQPTTTDASIKTNPPKAPTIPTGGMDPDHLSALATSVSGFTGSVAGAISLIGLDSAKYDHAVVATQLLRNYGITPCRKCLAWSLVYSSANPVCANCLHG